MGLFEIKNPMPGKMPKVEKPIPLERIEKLSKQAFMWEGTLGQIPLHRLKLKRMIAIRCDLYEKFPDYKMETQIWQDLMTQKLAAEANKQELSEEKQAQFDFLFKKMEAYTEHYFLGCFFDDDPNRPQTVEELHDIMFDMGPSRDEFRNALLLLTGSAIEGRLDLYELSLSKFFNIPLGNELTMDTMVVDQAVHLNKAMKAMIGEDEDAE